MGIFSRTPAGYSTSKATDPESGKRVTALNSGGEVIAYHGTKSGAKADAKRRESLTPKH